MAKANKADLRSPSSPFSAKRRIFFTASRLRSSPSALMIAERAVKGAASSDLKSARAASGPPIVWRAAAAGPASVSSARYPARGLIDSFLPAAWTWDRKNAATFLSRLPAREARRGRTKRARSLSAPGRVT